MNSRIAANQRIFNTPECQRLCNRREADLERLASHCGWFGLSHTPIRVSVGQAIDMLILDAGLHAGFQFGVMSSWRPWLRNETLIVLGGDPDNWYFDGPNDLAESFWPELWKDPRNFAGRLLKCCTHTAARQCRFHSAMDVECLTNAQFEQGNDGRTPLLIIDAHDLARRVRAACSGPLFTASAASPAF